MSVATSSISRVAKARTEQPASRVSSDRGLLRVEEAAEWLGLGRTKAYELVYRGILPSVTIGRARRVPRTALENFVERLTEEAGYC